LNAKKFWTMKFYFNFFLVKGVNFWKILWTKDLTLDIVLWYFCLKFPHILLQKASSVNFRGPFVSEFKSKNFSWSFLYFISFKYIFTPKLDNARLKIPGHANCLHSRPKNFKVMDITSKIKTEIKLVSKQSRCKIVILFLKNLDLTQVSINVNTQIQTRLRYFGL